MSSSMSSGGNLAQSVAERLADQIQVLTKKIRGSIFFNLYQKHAPLCTFCC